VAVIDEAQNLPLDALEELRMLSNMETEKSKLIQIVLVGQPDLRDTLERPSLEQLRQRVTVRYHLDRLDQHETEQYINHRLKRAATAAALTFPRDVTNAIHVRSGGVPRMVNVICDGVLLCGYAEESRVIDQQLVRMAIEELESSNVLRPSTNVGARVEVAPSSSVAAAEPARPPVVAAPAVSAPTASPAVPWTRASLAEMQLRPLAQSPAPFTDRPLREPELARSAAAPAPASFRQPVTRTGYAPTANTPRTVAQVRPAAPRQAAFNVEPARPGGTWTWLKDVLFGSGPQAERR
jgi:general secretion pathway protein A